MPRGPANGFIDRSPLSTAVELAEGERRLAAIMFTDLVGYTAMAQADEPRTLEVLRGYREVVRPILARHGGREVKTMGDGFLVEFASALAATNCGVEMQTAMRDFGKGGEKVKFRVGIHVGDVVHEGGDVFGDAVNVASRIDSRAEEGGVCISEQVYDQVRNKISQAMVKLEPRPLKGVRFPVDVYRVVMPWEPGPPPSAAEPARNRIAVLPFVNMSPDPNDEYFADGMTEEVISTLARLHEVEVISRTSVMQYKKSPKQVKDVSTELNAGMVIEGSVRKAGNRVRITAQMIEAQRDMHLWAESYDRDLGDVFGIQSDIAKLVADALKAKILPSTMSRIEQSPTTNSRAYTLYLKGRYYWNMRRVEEITRAEGLFKGAVKEDPAFALGYVGLGDCYYVLSTTFGVEVDENRRRAKEVVAKALELDPDLAEAHASRGIALLGDIQLEEAEKEFVRAIALKPSYASAHQWYGQLLIARTSWDEARSHIEKAAELDPFSKIISLVHIFLHEARRDYSGALELAKRGVELNPEDASSRFELLWLYGKLGMFGDMDREAEEGVRLARAEVPRAAVSVKAMTSYLRGDRGTVRELLPELEAHPGESFTTVRFIADLHFYLGDVDGGFDWLDKSLAKKEFDLIYSKSNEFLDGVRTDERYLRLMKKLGLG